MRELHVVAMSEDGRHVVLATRKGASSGEYRVALDERLAAAVRGDLPRPGEAEPAVVTPKEIQARLRAGESPEQIAVSAGVPITKIERYAGPVLSERERVLEQARAGFVSRSRLGASALPLGEAVDRHLADTVGVRLETVEWAARREEAGTWLVELSYVSQARRRSAIWRYDVARREVTATDTASAALAHVEPGGRRSRGPEHELAIAHLPARRPTSRPARRTAPARARTPKAAPTRTVAPRPPVRVAAPVPKAAAAGRAAQTAADKAAAVRAAQAEAARVVAQERAAKASAAEAARQAAAAEAAAAKQARAAQKRAEEQAAERAAKAEAARKAKAAEERRAKAEAAKKAKAAEERRAKAEAARKAKAAEERRAKAEAARKAKAAAEKKAQAEAEKKAKAAAAKKAQAAAAKKAQAAAAKKKAQAEQRAAAAQEVPPGPPTLRVVGSDDPPAPPRRGPKEPPAAARTAPARAAGQRASVPGWADVLLSTAPVARSADTDPTPDED